MAENTVKRNSSSKGAAARISSTSASRQKNATSLKRAGTKPTATAGQQKAASKANAKKPTPKTAGKAPEQTSMIYGAEALAALTVAESKLSRFKGRVILILVIFALGLLFWNVTLHATKPEPRLLAVTKDGRYQPLPLLDEPLESRQVLMDWVRRNIPDLYDWNYANFGAELNKMRDYVQQITLEEFADDLEASGILSKVQSEFLILRASITNEPLIVNETVINGRRVYVVEIPMRLVYDSGDVSAGKRRQINQDILFTAWIVRASILEYDAGLMLAKYSVKPM